MIEDDLTEDDFDALEKEMLENKKVPRGKRILVCPICGSTEISYYLGLKTGYQYQCKHCNYVGALVLEMEPEQSPLRMTSIFSGDTVS
ncbi:MAG: hypothetical protein Q7J35_17590 [Candidatus Methanoperedens sp.]|nr:hypothetical protein [Candidatus Methanoperedens sp.]